MRGQILCFPRTPEGRTPTDFKTQGWTTKDWSMHNHRAYGDKDTQIMSSLYLNKNYMKKNGTLWNVLSLCTPPDFFCHLLMGGPGDMTG